MSEKTLSLSAAILININIMMGVGIFINVVELSKRTGALGAFLYPLMGLLILPLIMSIARIMKIHPTGGFYGFGAAEIHPFAGFIAGWSYFTGKLASAILMIHVAVSLLQKIIVPLNRVNIFVLDVLMLSLFILLNMGNIRLGSVIQAGFLGLKLIPVLTIIGLGFLFFDSGSLVQAPVLWDGVLGSLPLVLYAAMGFEATCSLSSKITNAAVNGPKAIYYSFFIVMILIFLFQGCFFLLLGNQLLSASGYLNAFPLLFARYFSGQWTLYALALMHGAIACSALGGSYGILYSNSWNLYTLAQHNHVIARPLFTHLNRMGIPVYCILAEGLLCLAFLVITAGVAIPLQQISALSSVVAYLISVIALMIVVGRQKNALNWLVPLCGLGSCLILLGACIRNFLIAGFWSLLLFAGLGIIGISMFMYKRHIHE